MTERVKEWVTVLGFGLVAGVVLWGVGTAVAPGPPLALCLFARVAAAVAVWALAVAAPEGRDPRPVSVHWLPPVRPGLLDVTALEAVLRAAREDQERFDTRVRPRLVELTVELVRQEHGLRWPADGPQVQAVVGDRLWTLLTRPAGAVAASPARVREWIEDLEALVERT